MIISKNSFDGNNLWADGRLLRESLPEPIRGPPTLDDACPIATLLEGSSSEILFTLMLEQFVRIRSWFFYLPGSTIEDPGSDRLHLLIYQLSQLYCHCFPSCKASSSLLGWSDWYWVLPTSLSSFYWSRRPGATSFNAAALHNSIHACSGATPTGSAATSTFDAYRSTCSWCVFYFATFLRRLYGVIRSCYCAFWSSTLWGFDIPSASAWWRENSARVVFLWTCFSTLYCFWSGNFTSTIAVKTFDSWGVSNGKAFVWSDSKKATIRSSASQTSTEPPEVSNLKSMSKG